MHPVLGGPKIYRSCGSGSGSPTLLLPVQALGIVLGLYILNNDSVSVITGTSLIVRNIYFVFRKVLQNDNN
jgi:hypothetical protein